MKEPEGAYLYIRVLKHSETKQSAVGLTIGEDMEAILLQSPRDVQEVLQQLISASIDAFGTLACDRVFRRRH